MSTPADSIIAVGILSSIATLFGNIRKAMDDQFIDDVFYKLDVPMVIVGLDGKPMRVNRACERLLGYSEHEMKNMHFREFTAEADKDRDMQLYLEIVDGKRNDYWITKTWIRKTGEPVTGVLQVMALRDSDGSFTSCIAVVQPLKNSQAKRLMKEESDSPAAGIFIQTIRELRKTKKLTGVVTALFFALLAFYLFIAGGFSDILEIIKAVVVK